MKIKKPLTDLAEGTIIIRETGIIQLTSGYNEYHNWYNCVDLESETDDGDLLPVEGSEGHVTPQDLVGGAHV